jgi:mono/diheme cytochrome c family protein
MKKFVSGIFAGFFLAGLIVAGVFATGGYNVAATAPPSRLEAKVAAWALNRSVARRAPSTKNPLPATPETWKAGLDHYRENCVVCHGAPGVDAGEIGMGLNPPAPDLTLPRVQARPDGELFWIVGNGIRTTGMPAFSPTHKPEELWKVVAFLRHLPELTDAEQKTLKAVGEEAVQHHEEGEGAKAMPEKEAAPAAAPTKASHTHKPGTPPHKD